MDNKMLTIFLHMTVKTGRGIWFSSSSGAIKTR
jgi:hypothetical protein